jgi:transposase
MSGTENERIFVSKKSVYQARVLADFTDNKISRSTAAGLLNLSERQVSRLAKRFANSGLLGVQHKTLGKTSNRATDKRDIEKIRLLFSEKYVNFNYSHFKEMLERFENIILSYSTVRRSLKDLNLVKRPRKLRKLRRYRARKASCGLLLQMDGSDHEWVRGAGAWNLIAGIDDATGKVPYGEFFPTETLEGYTAVLSKTFAIDGVPRAVYIDCASWLSGTTQSEESGQFKRMCKELNIHPIYAESAQAKGRIERLWGSFQDRLVAELQLHKIKTMREATRYLNEEFLPYWNAHFTIKPLKLESVYQKSPSREQLTEIFSLKFERKIKNDETIHWKNHLYQSMHNFGYSIAKRTAEIRLYSDGTIRGFYGGKDLELKKIKRVQDDQPEALKTVHLPLAGLKINFARGDFLNKKSFK